MKIVHTYRGNVEETCLKNKELLFDRFFEEMYTHGIIKEQIFDSFQVPMDRNSDGTIVDRNLTIASENRQRAKVLSAVTQVNERKSLLFSKRMEYFEKQKQLFESESETYELNKICEHKLSEIVVQSFLDVNNGTSEQSTSTETYLSFDVVSNSITYALLRDKGDKIPNREYVAFIRVRSKAIVRGGKLSYLNVPSRKDQLMSRLVQLRNEPVNARKFAVCPVPPRDE